MKSNKNKIKIWTACADSAGGSTIQATEHSDGLESLVEEDEETDCPSL